MENIKELIGRSSYSNLNKKDLKLQNTKNVNLAIKHSIEDLKKLTKSFIPSPSIYELLISYSKLHSVKLLIPDTLLYLPSLCFPVFLRTLPNGVVSIDSSKSSVDNFFREKQNNPQKLVPKYIHIAMNERIKLCYNNSEARNVFEDCPHFSHRLHRYTQSSGTHTTKIRVHWKAYKPSTTYVISNKIPISWTKDAKPNHKNSTNIEKSLFKQKFQNVSLPLLSRPASIQKLRVQNRSQIENTKFGIYLDDIKHEDYTKFFVQVKGNADNNITMTNRYYPELQESFKIISSIYSTLIMKKFNSLEELLIDFTKSIENKWVLLSCKGYKARDVKNVVIGKKKIQEKQKDLANDSFYSRKHSVIMCESVSEESLMSDASSVSDNEESMIEKAARRFDELASHMDREQCEQLESNSSNDYLMLKQSDDIGRIPHLMIGIMPHKVGNSITYFIEKSKEPPVKPTKHKNRAKNLHWAGLDKISPEKYAGLASKNISNVSKIYNQYRYQGAVGREYLITKSKITEILQVKGLIIVKAVEDFFMDVKKNEHYSIFFDNRTESEIKYLSTRIVESLNPISELNLRESLRFTHKRLGITKIAFENFVNDLVDFIKTKTELQSSQADSIAQRLRSLEKEIVSE